MFALLHITKYPVFSCGNKPIYVIVLVHTRRSSSAMAAGCEYALRLGAVVEW
ncbi:hypothetical protein ANAPRD1_00054 [Anaplasma phagocytophilum]|nr:hypothetical protein ANAPRD1_00054 [Anaplasma phagocytophilum]SCV62136.1 hypothetical protein ANAPH1_00151 [Anaplasma phagocytophilum]